MGEVVELGCYLRDGSRGESHKACAIRCQKAGGSLAVVEDDTGVVYAVAQKAPASDPDGPLLDLIAARVEVRGRLYQRAGMRVILLDSVTRLR